MFEDYPEVILKKSATIKIKQGYPWFFGSECQNLEEVKLYSPGSLVTVLSPKKECLGVAYVNPVTTLIGQMLLANHETISAAFFIKRFNQALELRKQFYERPFYRLIHSEADGLPGLTIDRMHQAFVVQITTKGMEQFENLIIDILKEQFAAEQIYLKNDSPIRIKENLELYSKQVWGDNLHGRVEVLENGCLFEVNLLNGQKTGWFYDQRENRKWVAELAIDKTMLDGFCYLGGFGIPALKMGAKQVTFLDSSFEAIEGVKTNIALNNIDASKVNYIHDKAFEALEKLELEKKEFDIVCLDPPAFIKTKKDIASGLKGYQKLARLGAPLVASGGMMVFSSCSHHAYVQDLLVAINAGIQKANREAVIIKISGAAMDHPIHPMLPESQYLKTIVFKFL